MVKGEAIVLHSSPFTLHSSYRQQMAVDCIQLNDHGFAQSRVRHAVTKHDPPIALAGHVDRFVAWPMQDRQCPHGGIVAQHPARTARRIVRMAQGQKEDGAEHNPRGVEQPVASPHRGYHIGPMTRAEIEEKLVAIVRNEKDVPEDKLSLETPLADAGIDSLDALTILFAIEEEFHISIPDDRARSMKTFGDMVDSIEALVQT
jgi:acyl carrier protein